MYKLMNEVKDSDENILSPALIFRKTDSTWIQKDNQSIDYQEYLKWVEEGNTPDAAD